MHPLKISHRLYSWNILGLFSSEWIDIVGVKEDRKVEICGFLKMFFLKAKIEVIILRFKSLNFGFSKAELSGHLFLFFFFFFINYQVFFLSLSDHINILKGREEAKKFGKVCKIHRCLPVFKHIDGF